MKRLKRIRKQKKCRRDEYQIKKNRTRIVQIQRIGTDKEEKKIKEM